MACPQCHKEHPRDQACLPCWARIAWRDRDLAKAEAKVERLRAALVEVRDEARAMLLTIDSTPGLPPHLTQHAAAGLRDAVDALDALEADHA